MKTLKHRTTRTGLAALSVTLMLALSACAAVHRQPANPPNPLLHLMRRLHRLSERVCCFHPHHRKGFGLGQL